MNRRELTRATAKVDAAFHKRETVSSKWKETMLREITQGNHPPVIAEEKRAQVAREARNAHRENYRDWQRQMAILEPHYNNPAT